MVDAADVHMHVIALYGDGRHMLLQGSIHGVRDELYHGLPAADQRNAGIIGLHRYVATVLALIELNLHGIPLPSWDYGWLPC